MLNKILLSSALLGAAVVAQAAPIQTTKDFSATYKVMWGDSAIGSQAITLNSVGNVQTAVTHAKVRGVAALALGSQYDETSVWRTDQADKLMVDSYVMMGKPNRRRRGAKAIKKELGRLDYDWANLVVNSNINGTKRKLVLEPGTVNPHAMPFTIMHQLHNAVTPPETIPVRFVGKNKIRNYTFKRLPNEKVMVGTTEYDAIKYQRVNGKGSRFTTLWFAPALNNVMVKLEKRKYSDDPITASLQSITFK